MEEGLLTKYMVYELRPELLSPIPFQEWLYV
ncbi:uncharacterized protein METZ01_LOCUS92948 [marine metagenome]|uniref:Uncharacterized protein n=1 Tax=marine metagenome TaxID=408172 RepID=A0A381VIS3_9ZZZZ